MYKLSEFLVKDEYHPFNLWALNMVQILLRQYIQYSERENFGKHLKILMDTAIIYYITEFKQPEISIFRNTAVTNIRKYQTYEF
jgi:uncharacterized protein YbcV (DUF1398 family)